MLNPGIWGFENVISLISLPLKVKDSVDSSPFSEWVYSILGVLEFTESIMPKIFFDEEKTKIIWEQVSAHPEIKEISSQIWYELESLVECEDCWSICWFRKEKNYECFSYKLFECT